MFTKNNKLNIQQIISKKILKITLACLAPALPTFAYAQASESPVGQGLYYVINSFIYGTDGIAIAILAVGGSFAAACFHKIQWVSFLMVFAAISGIFGAPAIVTGVKSLITT